MDKLRVALRAYLEWLGEGCKESEIPARFKQIHKLAVRRRYVEVTRTRTDWLVNPSGRRP